MSAFVNKLWCVLALWDCRDCTSKRCDASDTVFCIQIPYLNIDQSRNKCISSCHAAVDLESKHEKMSLSASVLSRSHSRHMLPMNIRQERAIRLRLNPTPPNCGTHNANSRWNEIDHSVRSSNVKPIGVSGTGMIAEMFALLLCWCTNFMCVVHSDEALPSSCRIYLFSHRLGCWCQCKELLAQLRLQTNSLKNRGTWCFGECQEQLHFKKTWWIACYEEHYIFCSAITSTHLTEPVWFCSSIRRRFFNVIMLMRGFRLTESCGEELTVLTSEDLTWSVDVECTRMYTIKYCELGTEIFERYYVYVGVMFDREIWLRIWLC